MANNDPDGHCHRSDNVPYDEENSPGIAPPTTTAQPMMAEADAGWAVNLGWDREQNKTSESYVARLADQGGSTPGTPQDDPPGLEPHSDSGNERMSHVNEFNRVVPKQKDWPK